MNNPYFYSPEIHTHLNRKLPYHQPIPMFDESNHVQTHNAEKQPLIDVSTIEIPDGEDIPDNIMIWGLPKTSSLDTDTVPYSGNLQNVEILHKPKENVKYFNLTEEGQNGRGNILQTIEEVDFLGGVKDDTFDYDAQDQDQYHSLHEVVLSREELEMKLKEMRKNVGHLFLFMKGTWQYSDNGIDWEPANFLTIQEVA